MAVKRGVLAGAALMVALSLLPPSPAEAAGQAPGPSVTVPVPDPNQPLPHRPRIIRGQVIYRLPMPMREVAYADQTLSHLCRRGAFVQKMNGFYWARTPERAYGVGFPSGANLDDPQGRARPGQVYFFQNPDAFCIVWVADQRLLMPHYVGPPLPDH